MLVIDFCVQLEKRILKRNVETIAKPDNNIGDRLKKTNSLERETDHSIICICYYVIMKNIWKHCDVVVRYIGIHPWGYNIPRYSIVASVT